MDQVGVPEPQGRVEVEVADRGGGGVGERQQQLVLFTGVAVAGPVDEQQVAVALGQFAQQRVLDLGAGGGAVGGQDGGVGRLRGRALWTLRGTALWRRGQRGEEQPDVASGTPAGPDSQRVTRTASRTGPRRFQSSPAR